MFENERADVYQKITDAIVASIEAGVGRWEMPWHKAAGVPRNITGKAYRGINIVSLWGASQQKGYECQTWATYKQWQERNCQVRKGEKSTAVTFWKFFGKSESESDDDTPESRSIPFARMYHVFNAHQVDGFTMPTSADERHNERIQAAESFVGTLGATIRTGEPRAYYAPSLDFVNMPRIELFRDSAAYYGTLLHELTHWTGHESRVNRCMKGRFGDSAYAMEELIAELGAAFLCGHLGIEAEPREDHARYISSWLEVLKRDKRAIFTAASKAQTAVDWMQARAAKESELVAA